MMRTAPPPRLEEIADRIYAYLQPDGTWCLNNAAFLVGPDAVTLVDTAATERRARGLREAIASVTALPPRTVVNTHHHGDHTYGNGLFARDALIIGHDACPAAMAEQGLLLTLLWPHVEWGEVEVTPPTVTFPDRLTLRVGELEVELIFVGPAHTDNDIVAWVPEHRLLLAGDVVFNGGTPFVLWGSVAGSLAALDRLRALGAETVLPGHGPVGGPELFDRAEAYLRWVQDVARHGAEAGLSPLEAARETDLGEFAGLTDSERLVGNLHRAYAERRGEPPGAPLDTMTAMLEMVEYNGGQAPTCLA
ncbi:MBL fold metallo-hydrolase [Actinomadura sp. NPDC047616]|uniref:MBL fold metallo-hydrolase n=1 Tax=Actinomadura sp. NPDC047616 TaxID=3155914 RepID=UPI0033D6E293